MVTSRDSLHDCISKESHRKRRILCPSWQLLNVASLSPSFTSIASPEEETKEDNREREARYEFSIEASLWCISHNDLKFYRLKQDPLLLILVHSLSPSPWNLNFGK
jgi:hypothetical protein